MRIGLNLLYLLPGQVGGTETYASELIHALNSLDHNDDYIVFVNKESSDFRLPLNTRFKKVICEVRASNRMHRYFFEQFVLPILVQRHKVDILHSMGYVGPALLLKKHIITIHDANFVRLAGLMSPTKRWVYGGMARLSAFTCSHIVTISEFAKEELAECLQLPPKKMTVIHHGAPTGNAQKNEHSNGPHYPSPYILVIGGGSRHKNIRAFVEAFVSVQDCFSHHLVIAGRLSDSFEDAPDILAQIQAGRISITGYLDPADLDATYRGADLFVFPTLYEGFGLPLLEAQARGVPVLCSQVASLPELGGNSVAYFEPSSIEDMAAKLVNLLRAPEALKDLATRGRKNIHRFTWEQAAVQTHAIYHKLLS